MTIYWIHANTLGDGNNVGFAYSVGPAGTHAVAGGGYAHYDATGSSTETNGNSADGMYPIVAAFPQHDPGPDITSFRVGFAVPEGMTVRTHVWCYVP